MVEMPPTIANHPPHKQGEWDETIVDSILSRETNVLDDTFSLDG